MVAALYMCYDPMKKLGEMHNRMKQGEASLDRLEEILGAEESVPDPESPVSLEGVKGEVVFENVSFSYGEMPALEEISVRVPAGQIVALVGPSGAGKTTFASMVPRFYDPQRGAILLDGIDLRDAAKRELRERITLVPQEAVLFSGTVEENIRLGRDGASDAEVREAAQAGPCPRLHRATAEGLRDAGGRARGAALGRAEAADLDGAGVPQERAGADPRRGDQRAGLGERGAGAG